jgi:hypothetical protein
VTTSPSGAHACLKIFSSRNSRPLRRGGRHLDLSAIR